VSKKISDVQYIMGFNNNNLAWLSVEQAVIKKTQPSRQLVSSKNYYLTNVVLGMHEDCLVFVAL
jgi:hypothetical protein